MIQCEHKEMLTIIKDLYVGRLPPCDSFTLSHVVFFSYYSPSHENTRSISVTEEHLKQKKREKKELEKLRVVPKRYKVGK